MTDAGIGQPMAAEEVKIRQAADQSYRELEGELSPQARPIDKLLDAVRTRTREAPLQALAVAFILGAMAVRR
jgi:hypothetical protein